MAATDCLAERAASRKGNVGSAAWATPSRHRAAQAAPDEDAAAAAPSPDTAVKRLIGSLDTLQQQQAHAEARRHAAEQAAAAASAEVVGLKAALLEALQRVAGLDDQEQTVQAALDTRLQEHAQRGDQLRLARQRLSGLRAECSGSGEELRQKQALVADLQSRLRAAGIDEAALAQLCSGAEQSCVAGGQGEMPDAGRRRATWLSGGSSGLLSGFRRRGTTAG